MAAKPCLCHTHPKHNRILFVFLSTFLVFFVLLWNAKAEEPKTLIDIVDEQTLPEGVVRYAPEDCDFEMLLPGEPMAAQRCPSGPKSCVDLVNYTMVYDVTTTVEVNITCIASTPAQYKNYSRPVIHTALKGMIGRSNIDNAKIDTVEKDDHRMGTLFGNLKRGLQDSVYNAQIWVGQNSVLTVESHLAGSEHEKADADYSLVIQNIKRKQN